MWDMAKDQLPKIMEMLGIDQKNDVAKAIVLSGWLIWHAIDHLYGRL